MGANQRLARCIRVVRRQDYRHGLARSESRGSARSESRQDFR